MRKATVVLPEELAADLPAEKVVLGTRQAVLRLEPEESRRHLNERGDGFIFGQLGIGKTALLAQMYHQDRKWAAWLRDYHFVPWVAAAFFCRLQVYGHNHFGRISVSSVLLLEESSGRPKSHAYPWLHKPDSIEKQTFARALEGVVGHGVEIGDLPFTVIRR